jgi:hypothetical protein
MASIIWLVGNLVVNSLVKELVAPTKPTMNIIFIINNYFNQKLFYILLYAEFSSLDLIKIFQKFKEILTNKLNKLKLFYMFTCLDLFNYIVENILSDSIEISKKWININCKECVVGNMKC